MKAPPSQSAEALRSDPEFQAVKQALVARTGHHYYADKDDLLWERLRRRLAATRRDGLGAYLGLLEGQDARAESEWAQLEAEITIGETYFFRYAEQFAALRDHILPQVIAGNAEARRLRIWSAGCSTGAEPYSIAIVVSELLGDRVPDWRITILGTDLNEDALVNAREARYGPWALRTVTPEQRNMYFERESAQRWRLRSRYRSLVRFQRHNLVTLLDAHVPLQFSDFDVILCRNVLIYFHPEQGLQIVRALRDRLSETGWLILGHADANPWHADLMSVQTFDGAVAYRKRADEEDQRPAKRDLEVPPPTWVPALPIEPDRPPPRRRPIPADIARQPVAHESVGEDLDAVRRLADLGRCGDALQKARALRDEGTGTPSLFYYLGLLETECGSELRAEDAYRSALYLDSTFAMAHYQMGLLLSRQGRVADARRAIGNAARLAAARPGDDVLRDGDGLNAATLYALARQALAAQPYRPGEP